MFVNTFNFFADYLDLKPSSANFSKLYIPLHFYRSQRTARALANVVLEMPS